VDAGLHACIASHHISISYLLHLIHLSQTNQPEWDSCTTRRRSAVATSTSAQAAATTRKLQGAFERLKAAAGDDGARELLRRALAEAARRDVQQDVD